MKVLDVDVRSLEEEVDAFLFAKAAALKAREKGVLIAWGEGGVGHSGRGAGAAFSRALEAALAGESWDEALAREAEKLGATAVIQIYDSFSIHLVLLKGAEPAFTGPCPRCGGRLLALLIGSEVVPVACTSCGDGARQLDPRCRRA